MIGGQLKAICEAIVTGAWDSSVLSQEEFEAVHAAARQLREKIVSEINKVKGSIPESPPGKES